MGLTMREFICESWCGESDTVAAENEDEAAHIFARARFSDYPGNYAVVWTSEKSNPGSRSRKVLVVPGCEIGQTDQFRELVSYIMGACGGREKDAEMEAALLLAESDFMEIEPGIVPLEIGDGRGVFAWQLAGPRE